MQKALEAMKLEHSPFYEVRDAGLYHIGNAAGVAFTSSQPSQMSVSYAASQLQR
jgi:hypothetical protein